jgi:hypothetical protein
LFCKVLLSTVLLLALSACVATPGQEAWLEPLRDAKSSKTGTSTEESLSEDKVATLTIRSSLPELDPSSLIGSDRDVLQAKLGDPFLRRREGQTEVWQYRMQNCIIDFILPNGEAVTALQSRHPQPGETYDPLSCRRDMAQLAGL